MSRPRRGPKTIPSTELQADLDTHDQESSAAKIVLSRKARRFLENYAALGFRSPDLAAQQAGYSEPRIGWKLINRYGHLIEAERVRASMTKQMSVDEALRLVAGLARSDPDSKIRLAATRTALQVEGALGGETRAGSGDKGGIARQLGELIEAVKGKSGQVRARVAIAVEATSQEGPSKKIGSGDSLPDPEDI